MERPQDWTAGSLALLAAAAVNALIAVAAGAFGAHVLEERLDARALEVFEIGARYHVYHALGMGLCAVAARLGLDGAIRAGWFLQAGVALFAGTLYALALSGVKVLGAVTPIGGVLMMVGWVLLAVAAVRQGRRSR